ncbi:MAG: hypothetical protein IT211_06535 [Armatimonadetes bacterium]|nr:hypothetical protein [Armatimonadota bacterium]
MKLAGLLITAALTLGTLTATAQPLKTNTAPDGQLGIGINTSGATVQFAISPSLQAGVLLNVGMTSSTTEIPSGGSTVKVDNSTTNFGAEIYGRFLFEGLVNPFVQLGLALNNNSSTQKSGSTETSQSRRTMDLNAYFGLAYYFTRQFGIFGQVGLVGIGISDKSTSETTVTVETENPTETSFGIGSGRVGLEFFFN